MADKDEIVKSVPVYQTKDYGKFKHVPGNRPISNTHVKNLVQSMIDKGNLMADEPAEVDKDFYVYDGQNRLEAVKFLEQPFYYKIIEHPNTDTLRVRNSNRKNWDWKDYTYSYATDPTKSKELRSHYQLFSELMKNFNENFGVLLVYCGYPIGGRMKKDTQFFYDGEFVMQNYEEAQQLLGQCQELAKVSKQGRNRELALACYKIMKESTYNHDKMTRLLRVHFRALDNCWQQSHFENALRDISRLSV